MSTELVKCPVCKEQVYRNKSGKILAHTGRYTYTDRVAWTRRGYGKFIDIEVCPGSTKGARP